MHRPSRSSALVWRHVNPRDVSALVELRAEYHDVVRPWPLPLAQRAGQARPQALRPNQGKWERDDWNV